ncbi:PLP-dependent transferase [Dichomitus squalens LYAD-421 SS1]|uniref:PLP-dependent transferase n=1 Tax=Dichomitus squalens (strain LYAD-421) TaxID=732165 RepID=R7SKX5_DICSQ|nr:PLP-dependent transferase [Dichomitus squalens LYAD-421 SS1]EJF56523.1 PLP-dependent transferase [Dichomitus squalens LYAD-421 SS1]
MSGPLATALGQAIAYRQKRSIPTLDLLQEVPSSASDLLSNDYLSLALDPALRIAALKTLADTRRILGSGGSRVLNGNTAAHVVFEARMKHFFGAPAALLCNSGYDANVAFWRSIPQEGDAVVYDELVHASTRDGMAESRAKGALFPFRHNSVASFRECLSGVLAAHPAIAAGRATVFVAVESLYSMDGDFAPLHEIVRAVDELVSKNCGHIMVDEAHSTGIYGSQGRGFVAALGLTGRIDTVLHPFGKARATSGAVLLTSAIVRHYIINYGRPFIFSTSMPGALVCLLDASPDHIGSHAGDEARERLHRLSEHFHRLVEGSLKHVPPSLLSLLPRKAPGDFPNDIVSPIFPILTEHPVLLAAHLRRYGYACTSVPYPAVPRGQERIRVVVHAANKPEELRELVTRMLEWAASMQARAAQPQLRSIPTLQARL